MACQEAFLFEFMGSINSNAFLGEQIHFTSLTKFVNPTANPAVTYVCKLGLAMRMWNMRFMRIMREYADADENLIHIIHI